jgi:hypothetical protein
MTPLHLLEAEGLDAAMLRAFLGKHYAVLPCAKFPVCSDIGPHTHHGQGVRDFIVPDTWELSARTSRYGSVRDQLAGQTLEALALYHAGGCVQTLLSLINPRMQPGWPTDGEMVRHMWWMVRGDGVPIRVVTRIHMGVWAKEEPAARVECWPCDAHGNKVRRGTR